MITGTSTFMGVTGLNPMVCTFTGNEEKSKGIFKRKTVSKTMLQGHETETYYCDDCEIMVPIIQ